MLTFLFSFLGSAALRLAIGHIFEFVTKWQDQKNELARLKLQGELDAAQHARNLEAMRVQSELGIKVVEANAIAHARQAEDDAFLEAVKATGQKTGIAWVDVWNGIIRPAGATFCLGLWMASVWKRGFVLNDWDKELMGMFLGIFVGGRIYATGR